MSRSEVKLFFEGLRSGPYAWPGGYPVSCVMSDGGLLCYKCAREHAFAIGRATRDHDRTGWDFAAWGVQWENDPEGGPDYCEQCCEELEVAYPEGAS